MSNQLQFHLQLMGRYPPNQIQNNNLILNDESLQLSSRQSSNSTFIDPISSDPSPYQHAMINRNSSHSITNITRPSSRASTFSSSALPIPPFYSSRHSTQPSPLPTTSSSNPQSPIHFFDPELEVEKLRLAKLEQRRSVGLTPSKSSIISSRTSSVGSITSLRSLRSARPNYAETSNQKFGLSHPAPSVYRPSPLRSTSTPDLLVVTDDADKKKKRKEMKEEYDKMRAARIEEEKQVLQRQRDDESHQSWFTSHFKRTKQPTSQSNDTQSIVDGSNERRSTSQSSSTDSSAPSSSAPEYATHSVATLPTSDESNFQIIDHAQKMDESPLVEEHSDHNQSYESPVLDPFRKSILPGQVPPTPTKINLLSPTRTKSVRMTPGRNNLNKLNRLFDTFKRVDGNKKKIQIDPTTHDTRRTQVDQTGWFDSIKSIRPKSRSSRRKTLVGIFLVEKDSPPPVPQLPEHIST